MHFEIVLECLIQLVREDGLDALLGLLATW